MTTVTVSEKSSFDAALRKFKRACEKSGTLTRLRDIEHYVKPTTKRKKQRAAAVKRRLKQEYKDKEVMERDRGRY
jgi:small subunit ribosomal protein S21